MDKNKSIEIFKKCREQLNNMTQEQFNKIKKEKGLDKKIYNSKDYIDDNLKIIENIITVKYIGNHSSAVGCINQHTYTAIAITEDKKILRVIDETGYDYLYATKFFQIIDGDINSLHIEYSNKGDVYNGND